MNSICVFCSSSNSIDNTFFQTAEETAEDSYDYESLAESIRDNLGDEKWAKLVEQKAKELEEEL